MNPEQLASGPLAQLRDIHQAPPPSWWPPAPGWWVLALIILIVLGWLLRRGWYWLGRRRQRRQILALFDAALPAFDQHGDRRRLAMELDVLMRRLAKLRFASGQASLTGADWLAAWRVETTDPMAQVLLQAPYQPDPDYDPAALHAWVLQRVRPHA